MNEVFVVINISITILIVLLIFLLQLRRVDNLKELAKYLKSD